MCLSILSGGGVGWLGGMGGGMGVVIACTMKDATDDEKRTTVLTTEL